MFFMGYNVNKRENIKMHFKESKPFMEKVPLNMVPTAVKAHKYIAKLLMVGRARNYFSTRLLANQ